jgi:Tfp pilus assembly protein PilN
MIKINLLGAAALPPRAKVAAPVSKAKQLGAFLVALVVSFAIVGVVYMIWSASVASLNVELRKQQAEQARLAAIKVENIRYERESALLEQRVNTVQVLRTSRLGPTEFMNALGDVVNKTPSDLYLFTVTPQSDRVVIHGQAGSPNAVAGLLSLMKTSGYFNDVQLRQFYEDDIQNVLSYKFNMDCLYKSPLAAGSLTRAGAGAKATTPPPRPGL